ncbi:allantoate amidohydrolase [Brevibacterium litoralis]|uniref:allantoate amidohydrolase n=1 Tax=Brevibacterium litoralis TaxID=3138935 RepID=UPI0032F022AA
MATVTSMLRDIHDIGRDGRTGGYYRPVWGEAELTLREWFTGEAQARGLDVQTDRNGIMWAWAGKPAKNALVTGSHLDSVPGGGAFDGPLGVASALAAYDELVARGVDFTAPGARPFVIAVFPEEEGSRFDQACLGSKLLNGAADPATVMNLKDLEGITFAEAAKKNGYDPARFGRDEEMLGLMGSFIELHVEQGVGLIDMDQPVAIAKSIIGSGRYAMTVRGEGNHAGATPMRLRKDPMVAAAGVVAAVRRAAAESDGGVATVGRLLAHPGGVNVIPDSVELTLDCRHADDSVRESILSTIRTEGAAAAEEEGCTFEFTGSGKKTLEFEAELSQRMQQVLPEAPLLESGAGHDAGILASDVSTGMLFVRNPTGISHSPEETCEDADADFGAIALADVLQAELTRV